MSISIATLLILTLVINSVVIYSIIKLIDIEREVDRRDKGKGCPKCGNINLIRYPSLNLKSCSDCGTDIPWLLEKGQRSLL